MKSNCIEISLKIKSNRYSIKTELKMVKKSNQIDWQF